MNNNNNNNNYYYYYYYYFYYSVHSDCNAPCMLRRVLKAASLVSMYAASSAPRASNTAAVDSVATTSLAPGSAFNNPTKCATSWLALCSDSKHENTRAFGF